MKVEPLPPNSPTFGNKIFTKVIKTSYGKHIKGNSRGYDYDVYIRENPETKDIIHKLYYVRKDGNWIKSRLLYFEDNKIVQAIRSKAKWL